MDTSNTITIRNSTHDDIPFIQAHAYRLLEFDLPSWRVNKEQMTQGDIGHITSALLSNDPNMAVLIAEDESRKPIGFLHLVMIPDYYTKKLQGHITDIVVIAEAEGKGIGKFLLQKAEEWAKGKGADWVTLNVFETNTRARAVYEKSGYNVEWIRYIKMIDDN